MHNVAASALPNSSAFEREGHLAHPFRRQFTNFLRFKLLSMSKKLLKKKAQYVFSSFLFIALS